MTLKIGLRSAFHLDWMLYPCESSWICQMDKRYDTFYTNTVLFKYQLHFKSYSENGQNLFLEEMIKIFLNYQHICTLPNLLDPLCLVQSIPSNHLSKTFNIRWFAWLLQVPLSRGTCSKGKAYFFTSSRSWLIVACCSDIVWKAHAIL